MSHYSGFAVFKGLIQVLHSWVLDSKMWC